MITQQVGLSNIQLELLKIYSNNIPDEQLFEVKLMLSQYFAATATAEMDKFLDENGLGEDTLVKWSNEHDRRESSN